MHISQFSYPAVPQHHFMLLTLLALFKANRKTILPGHFGTILSLVSFSLAFILSTLLFPCYGCSSWLWDMCTQPGCSLSGKAYSSLWRHFPSLYPSPHFSACILTCIIEVSFISSRIISKSTSPQWSSSYSTVTWSLFGGFPSWKALPSAQLQKAETWGHSWESLCMICGVKLISKP